VEASARARAREMRHRESEHRMDRIPFRKPGQAGRTFPSWVGSGAARAGAPGRRGSFRFVSAAPPVQLTQSAQFAAFVGAVRQGTSGRAG
jgi:hypothetical protein